MQRNRLATETSPYLLQHASNPVDWYPWGALALQTARQENKPILLSVGYSACHWCHVMAHESFEDPCTAALMNELFINIKVDREERPDLDKIYQFAQQMLTRRSGGWPLTMFLTPDQQLPFFGGTYFPKEARYGMPAFSELLPRICEYYHEHSAEIGQQNAQLSLAFSESLPRKPAAGITLDDTALQQARTALEQNFDSSFGGFGQAPKFPHIGGIEHCLRHWCGTSKTASVDLKALYMASLTLTRMAEGGLYDQLGAGFCRYSVDEFWMIPHFEKMLYDNGPFIALYAQAGLATGEALFKRIASETADWAVRDMRSPEGGFYASLDADSEGREGKFYVWTREAIEERLTPPEYSVFSRRFGLNLRANFESEWHLHSFESIEHIAQALELGPAEVGAFLDSARVKLLAARNLRVWPLRDEKILTAWNALMIKGLAVASRVLQRPDLADAAMAAVDFIRGNLWHEGRLLATYKDGRAQLAAYLDDYAFLADALLEVLQTRWRSSDLIFLQQLVEVLLLQFEDLNAGGFFFTASDHERLIHRSKTFSDDSMPAGNGVAASVLCRMGHLLGEMSYLDAAERTLKAALPMLLQYPLGHMSLLNALEDFLAPPQILIIRGNALEAQRWLRELGAVYAPTRMIFAIPDDEFSLPRVLADKSAGPDTQGYLCTAMTCSAPIANLSELMRLLHSS